METMLSSTIKWLCHSIIASLPQSVVFINEIDKNSSSN